MEYEDYLDNGWIIGDASHSPHDLGIIRDSGIAVCFYGIRDNTGNKKKSGIKKNLPDEKIREIGDA